MTWRVIHRAARAHASFPRLRRTASRNDDVCLGEEEILKGYGSRIQCIVVVVVNIIRVIITVMRKSTTRLGGVYCHCLYSR
jgi:hypothetical protein